MSLSLSIVVHRIMVGHFFISQAIWLLLVYDKLWSKVIFFPCETDWKFHFGDWP